MTVGPAARPDRDGRAAGKAAGTVQLAAPARRTAKLAAVPQAASTASAARPPRNPAVPPGDGEGLAAVDRLLQAWQARLTGGLSPVALSLAWFDWLAHLSQLPGRQAELA